MMRYGMLALGLLMLGCAELRAQTKEKSARAAFGFEGEKSKKEAAPTPAVSPKAELCNCHDTGSCKCRRTGPCNCCEQRLPEYSKQIEVAGSKGLVIVAYLGGDGTGTCFDGAISAAGPMPVGETKPGIWIGYGIPGNKVLMSERLDVTANRLEIEAAIKRAAGKRDQAAAPLPTVVSPPVSVQPIAPAAQWFSQATPVQSAPVPSAPVISVRAPVPAFSFSPISSVMATPCRT